MRPFFLALCGLFSVVVLTGCVSPNTRMGMVREPGTGLMFGSVVEHNIVTDADLFANRKIKLRLRNTSGDVAFDLSGFRRDLERAYTSLGYELTDTRDFGILIDVNVRYSGQVETDLSREFGYLGAAGGGTAGYTRGGGGGAAVGLVSGAALGSVIGSFVKDDTYIIVTDFTFSRVKWRDGAAKKRITFNRSPRPEDKDADDEEKEDGRQGRFQQTVRTGVSVFAGGRNVPQAQITGEVRRRLVRILRDII
ncbi:MAG: hypothetical protein H6906_03140 [Hyphomicrobiales bacterium]|nr:hypothetical protein [Hyphomicrobiales bacterium]